MPLDQYDDQTKKPTSASEWGKKKSSEAEGFICELPSGNVCRVKRTMDILGLLRSGRIPNPLAAIVQRMIAGKQSTFTPEDMDSETLQQLMDLLDSTTVKVMLEPLVSRPEGMRKGETWEDYLARIEGWEPDPDTISVFDIDIDDKLYLFTVAQGAAADLASFREEQGSALDALQTSERVGSKAKPTGGAAGPNREQRRSAAKKP